MPTSQPQRRANAAFAYDVFCVSCQKRGYWRRRSAARVASAMRREGKHHICAYPCPADPHVWHVGNATGRRL